MAAEMDMAEAGQGIDPNEVFDALYGVIDPEVGVNIVDLGLVYGVETRGADVHVRMTMTTPSCPLGDYLTAQVQEAVRARFGTGGQAEVELVWDPPWRSAMMSDAARQQLGSRRKRWSLSDLFGRKKAPPP